MSAGMVLVGGVDRGWVGRTPFGFSVTLVDNIDRAQRFTPEEAIKIALTPEVVNLLMGATVILLEIVESWEQTRANAITAVGLG